MSRNSTNQIKWLLGKLSTGKYSMEELQEEWKKDTGKTIQERSLFRWIANLWSKYNVLVVSENGKRYIADKGVFKQYDTEKWIAYTSKINDLIIKHDDIKDKILIDNIPSENQYLEEILNAISSQLIIKISYTKYSSDNSRNLEKHQYTIHPYCAKRFENRWYVIGLVVKRDKEDRHQIQKFSLDMINELTLQKKKFKPDPNFNAIEYFKDVYGITTDQNGPLTEIRISVDAWLANYLRTLPLHPSQKDVGGNDSFDIFQYTLRPANDFYQALLHHGSHLKVLSPESVRDEMKKLIQEMAEKYK